MKQANKNWARLTETKKKLKKFDYKITNSSKYVWRRIKFKIRTCFVQLCLPMNIFCNRYVIENCTQHVYKMSLGTVFGTICYKATLRLCLRIIMNMLCFDMHAKQQKYCIKMKWNMFLIICNAKYIFFFCLWIFYACGAAEKINWKTDPFHTAENFQCIFNKLSFHS